MATAGVVEAYEVVRQQAQMRGSCADVRVWLGPLQCDHPIERRTLYRDEVTDEDVGDGGLGESTVGIVALVEGRPWVGEPGGEPSGDDRVLQGDDALSSMAAEREAGRAFTRRRRDAWPGEVCSHLAVEPSPL